MYRTAQIWTKNRERKISFAIGDLFIDKNQSSQVIKECAVEEGIA